MKSSLTSVATMLIAGTLAAMPPLASAQVDLALDALAPPTSDSRQRLVESFTVAFAGFTSDGAATYSIEVALAPAIDARGVARSYVVALKDLGPTFVDPICANCSRVIEADATRPKMLRFSLESAWFHSGPLMLEMNDERSGELIASVGPLQLPEQASGIQPYGRVGLGGNDLHLHGYGGAQAGDEIVLQVFGQHEGASSVIGFSLHEARRSMPGGELLIDLGRAVTVPLEGSVYTLQVPDWMVGQKIYAQVASLEYDAAGREIARWSNGVQIDDAARR